MKSIMFRNYEDRVSMQNKYVVFNPNKKESSQRLSENSNYISIHAKKVDCKRMNKYHSVKDFISDQVTISWREGKFFIY